MIASIMQLMANPSFLPLLADAALKSTLLFVLAWLLVAALRKSSAAVRHLIWSVALLGAVLLPLFSWLLPAWPVPVLRGWWPVNIPPAVSTPAIYSASTETVRISPATMVEEEPTSVVQPTDSQIATIEPTVANSDGPVKISASPVPAQKFRFTDFLRRFGALIWLAGVGVAMLPLLAGFWQVWRLTRRCTTITGPDWKSLLENTADLMRLRRLVRLLCGPGVALPMTWGAWRPVLLVPEAARTWPASRRRMVLLHELAHVRRWDWLTQILAYFACALFWYNPLAWHAARRMRLEREQACDDLVLRRDTRPSEYAGELLQLATGYDGRGLIDWATVPMARRSAFEGRLLAILDERRNRAGLTRLAIFCAVVVATIVIIPVAMLRAASEPVVSPSDPTAQPISGGSSNPASSASGIASPSAIGSGNVSTPTAVSGNLIMTSAGLVPIQVFPAKRQAKEVIPIDNAFSQTVDTNGLPTNPDIHYDVNMGGSGAAWGAVPAPGLVLVRNLDGDAQLIDKDGKTTPLTQGETFPEGSTVKTGAETEGWLVFFDLESTPLMPNSTIKATPGGAPESRGEAQAYIVQGDVQLIDPDSKATPLTRGELFGEGQTIKVGTDGQALIVFSNGATLKLFENSSMKVRLFRQESFDEKADGTFLQLSYDPSRSNVILDLSSAGLIQGMVKRLNKAAGSTFIINSSTGQNEVSGPFQIAPTNKDSVPPKVSAATGLLIFKLTSLDLTAWEPKPGAPTYAWGNQGRHSPTLKIGGQEFADGITMIANGALYLKLDGETDKFNATIGMDGFAPAAGAPVKAVFRVLGDGKVLYESKPKQRGDAPEKISVDTHGVKMLALEVKTQGDYHPGDMRDADWADATLEVEATGDPPQAVEMPVPASPPLTDAQKAILKGPLAAFVQQLTTDTGIKLVPIPAGTFMMGSTEDEISQIKQAYTNATGLATVHEAPQTKVTLTKDFFIAATDVTQGQYEAVMGANPSHFTAVGKDAPVETLTWNDAMAFCQKLNEQERAAGRLPDGYTITLPTEAQWEYACSAGTSGPVSGELKAMAWYKDNSDGTTHPVATKQPNAWGLYDMHGNVWQWCLDHWTYRLPGGAITDPVLGPGVGGVHALRGGGWNSEEVECRFASRTYNGGTGGGLLWTRSYVGFRVALVPDKS